MNSLIVYLQVTEEAPQAKDGCESANENTQNNRQANETVVC